MVNVIEMPTGSLKRKFQAALQDDGSPGRIVVLELADIADQAETVRDRLTAVKAIGVALRDLYPASDRQAQPDDSGVADLIDRAKK